MTDQTRKTPVEIVVDKFGSATALAEALEMNRANVTHWRTRKNGLIPSSYHFKIIQAAKARGIDIDPADLVQSYEMES